MFAIKEEPALNCHEATEDLIRAPLELICDLLDGLTIPGAQYCTCCSPTFHSVAALRLGLCPTCLLHPELVGGAAGGAARSALRKP